MTSRAELRRFDVTKLVERPGKRHQLTGVVELEGVAISAAEATAVAYDLLAEAIGAQIVVEGTATARWRGECRRCLEAVEGESTMKLREIFEDAPVEGETYPIDDTHIDLAAMLEEAALLALPLAPLCGGGCGGPAPDRFPTGQDAPEESESTPDPRWAALDDLTFD